MENDKYFIPNIEDINIGYECEIYGQYSSELMRQVDWHKVKVGFHQNHGVSIAINQCKKLINSHHLRVPYLTKEQIEAEGWEHYKTYTDEGCMTFINEKKNYMIGYYYTEHRIKFEIKDPSLVKDYFNANRICGECKDINTFRIIIKLLKI